MSPIIIERIAYERQQDFLREAKRTQLVNAVKLHRFNKKGNFWKVTYWLGGQLQLARTQFIHWLIF
jgi:hypothetical protein